MPLSLAVSHDLEREAGVPRWNFGSAATIKLIGENAIKENAMHKLKILCAAVALLVVTPVLAQEMGGATGPGSARGVEPTYNDGYYNGYNQRNVFSPGGVGGGVGALEGNNSYAMSPEDGYCARRYRSYDPASGTYRGHDGRRHSCE
jgi:hypothetical protein